MKKVLLGICATLALTLSGCEKVPTGYVGVASYMGKIKPEVLPPGPHQKITQTVIPVSVRETTLSLDNLHPKTSNNVTMQKVDLDVRYMIQPNKVASTLSILAGDLSENANGDMVVGEHFVKRFALEAIYKAAAKYPADKIHTKREEIAADVAFELQNALNKAMPGAFVISGATVRQMITDPKLEQAITKAAQMQFEIDRATEQKALAEAQASVKLTEARAEADANEIIAKSLSPMLIRKMEIESQTAFAQQGTHTVLMGGNTTPLLNVK
jgi:regulator of protease activity HflC (stomatin/prohibitin superfamily)